MCIGACVAPILCQIFLAKFDNLLQGSLHDSRVCHISRYVDDFLIILKLSSNDTLALAAEQVLSNFRACSNALSFTHEVPVDNAIRFLDLLLTFRDDGHLCWCFSPRSKKALLPYSSAHSKIVKRGIASNCFRNALQKSCHHCIKSSFDCQVEGWKQRVFPSRS